jgi:serine/threonine-protein kinase
MARASADRPPDAASIAAQVRGWLDGARRREAALSVVAEAEAQGPAADGLRGRAAALRAEAARLLGGVKPWEPEERKAAGWARQDEAERLEQRAALCELKREALLQGALTHAPDLAEARAGLVQIELDRHVTAEATRDDRRLTRARTRMVEHLQALPATHPVASKAAAYLCGTGALTLHTDPPCAEVDLYRYEVRNRRLVPVRVKALGRTPLVEVPLAMGSYVCVLRHAGREEVRYPVHVGRGEHWDAVAPGERDPRPVHLPAPGDLGADDVYVPAGWFWSDGDADSTDSLPRKRLWCEGFVVKRFPVTNDGYVRFLDDLVAHGWEEEALSLAPREEGGTTGVSGAMIYGQDERGRFVLRPDSQGDVWEPSWPVTMVHFGCAVGYARWFADRTGQPWRLLAEQEWEKAVRGVDGRTYPWGDVLDPSWCCIRDSHAGRPRPAVVDSFQVDESVYGARGVGGNVRDWCGDRFTREGPATPGGRVMVVAVERDVDLSPASLRVVRGGHWSGIARHSRCTNRHASEPSCRHANIGLRLGRSYPLPS